MEDQRSDAGDLSDAADSAAGGSSPETIAAAAANRHRLPRGKARRPAVPASAEETAAEPASAAVELVESAAEAPDVESGVDSTDESQADEAEPDECHPDSGAAVATEDAEADVAVEPRQVVFVERRPPGRRAPIAIGVAAALFVGATGFAGAALYPYLVDRASAATKFEIASTAAKAITTLWTYTPDNMEQLADRSSKFLGGDFRNEYSKYIDAIVPTNKQAQVTNNTEVVGAAVESLNGPEATAIVYTNSTSTSPLTKNIPSMRYLSYRLTLHQDGPEWLVTGMTAITNLDLTPQI